jgi:hypothetical protein
MHADRANRIALIVFGLLALAAGAAGMTASVGGFGQALSHRTLFDNRVSAFIGDHGWVWYAAAGVCLIIILAALLWIAILLVSTDRADDIPIPVATHEGTTILLPAALTDALTREIGAYHGVEAVRGRIIGDADDPEIVLAVTASQTADLHALHQRIETEALAHARETLGKADLPIQLDLAVSRLRLAGSRLRNALIAVVRFAGPELESHIRFSWRQGVSVNGRTGRGRAGSTPGSMAEPGADRPRPRRRLRDEGVREDVRRGRRLRRLRRRRRNGPPRRLAGQAGARGQARPGREPARSHPAAGHDGSRLRSTQWITREQYPNSRSSCAAAVT